MALQRVIVLYLVLFSSSVGLALIRAQLDGLSPPPLPDINVPAASDAGGLSSGSDFLNITNILLEEMPGNADQCIMKPTDWDKAFNYSLSTDFMLSCLAKLGDVQRRLCTKAEVRFYMGMLANQSNGANFFQPNTNCNPFEAKWVSGCEPGWHCSLTLTTTPVNLRESTEIPSRTFNCRPCCDGFFCPEGLTCMLRSNFQFTCPLGAYCRSAVFSNTTGLCEPYNYQLPRGRPGHHCGGANIWARIEKSPEIFCPAGSYCPSTIVEKSCSSGHYCRKGSTEQTRCSKLISCRENTATQNIHAYGVMVIVALMALLLVIYNCSDQLISTRERRRAKSRERAIRSVLESEHARNRWKVVKESAWKRASKLQTSLSRTFSGRPPLEEQRVLGETSTSVVESGLPQPQSLEIEGRLKNSSRPTVRFQAPEDGSQSSGVSKDESKSTKNNIPKPSGRSTDTQIFTYAYAQIEKEKSRDKEKDISFSRVISMATGSEVHKRPSIEIVFRDLTITLKGKKRCLLKCLNGKIMPGRIAAVMGPSGAGKTTFLNALAGKATGCTTSGLILINGTDESIHSYRKIVGFVPQDDIVHGNLTVEENLWFSARCRLSACLRRADRVLIVERVLENLGLQEVRGSLVGTVEKRGISGGQRKRVNVGLELVMEPSLLFLDEPTSGLDSSSSRSLLQALRHEAQAGVNISMVVHQPSYALFQMFDDLVLLAKGGFMVYLGPVRSVEGYFEGIGINVPDRINPPDYFIDILEGFVDPSKGSVVSNHKQLPLIWMIQNGYTIPEDMQPSAVGLAQTLNGGNDSMREQETFAKELWGDIKSNAHQRQDYLSNNFLWGKDLSYRRTPNVILQYKYFLGRISKQRLREAQLQATDYLILLIAGACLGAITKIDDNTFGATNYTYTVIAVSLLCQIASLRTFSLDKLQYWRESASGMSSLAHFLAKDTIDLFNVFIKPAVYLSMFYFFTNPRSSFSDNYIVLVALVYCVTGMGYVFAIFLQPGPAQLFSVLLPVCLTLISSQSLKPSSTPVLKTLASLSYPKWILEAFVIANAKRYYGVWLIQRCMVLLGAGFSLHDWWKCIFIVIVVGAFSRVVAFIAMVALKKK